MGIIDVSIIPINWFYTQIQHFADPMQTYAGSVYELGIEALQLRQEA